MAKVAVKKYVDYHLYEFYSRNNDVQNLWSTFTIHRKRIGDQYEILKEKKRKDKKTWETIANRAMSTVEDYRQQICIAEYKVNFDGSLNVKRLIELIDEFNSDSKMYCGSRANMCNLLVLVCKKEEWNKRESQFYEYWRQYSKSIVPFANVSHTQTSPQVDEVSSAKPQGSVKPNRNNGYKTGLSSDRNAHEVGKCRTDTISVDKDIYGYIQLSHAHRVNQIWRKHEVQIKIKKLDKHNLSIQFTSDTKEKSSKAISDFQSLYQDVMDHIKQEDMQLKDHAVDHIKYAIDAVKSGNKHVYVFETSNKVSMLSEDKEALKQAKYIFEQCLSLTMAKAKPRSAPDQDNFTEVYKFVTKDGINVSVAHGNIALQDVDAIVNAANKYIQNGSGVTGAIFKQGGSKFEQLCKEAMKHRQNRSLKVGEVVSVKAAGNLQCKRVLHLVGPQWKNYSHKDEAYHLLEDGLLSVLKESNYCKASTLALPPVATGIYGTPLKLFVRAMNTALTCFETNISRHQRSLHYIRILSIDQDTVNDLKTMFLSRQPHAWHE
uniref:uncharacterized protein LOC100183098 isoform X2 n=1 Tax=Ciona intestinalis TaxID=7719 RepID=UPI000EF4E13C|nr:uncharacterized protein LOC100183098 isoform X2 [Ciona intestinalis]|eukprot:XP_026694500.1 uncharacterized protein LOC100183098 isoform X2 [Ciona intestinalis]